jgi:hypothetical protein
MNWKTKDGVDLALMAIGACAGVAVFGFVIAPTFGIEFVGGKPVNYMIAAVAGTVGGYALRFLVARYRKQTF